MLKPINLPLDTKVVDEDIIKSFDMIYKNYKKNAWYRDILLNHHKTVKKMM